MAAIRRSTRHDRTEEHTLQKQPVKTACMWRDIERKAKSYGLHPIVPAPYPLPGLGLANWVAMAGVEDGWVKE